jgi:hypothetical protein
MPIGTRIHTLLNPRSPFLITCPLTPFNFRTKLYDAKIVAFLGMSSVNICGFWSGCTGRNPHDRRTEEEGKAGCMRECVSRPRIVLQKQESCNAFCYITRKRRDSMRLDIFPLLSQPCSPSGQLRQPEDRAICQWLCLCPERHSKAWHDVLDFRRAGRIPPPRSS